MTISLPEFFQTNEYIFDSIEDGNHQPEDGNHQPLEQEEEQMSIGEYETEEDYDTDEEANQHPDEVAPFELIGFFEGIPTADMDGHLRAFDPGNTWMSNPVFTDEFTCCYLPPAFSNLLYELHAIFNIQQVVPADWNAEDARYSSLSEPQQARLRELIHENPEILRKLDDIFNRFRGLLSRTVRREMKFLLTKTIDVVQEVLCKNISDA